MAQVLSKASTPGQCKQLGGRRCPRCPRGTLTLRELEAGSAGRQHSPGGVPGEHRAVRAAGRLPLP